MAWRGHSADGDEDEGLFPPPTVSVPPTGLNYLPSLPLCWCLLSWTPVMLRMGQWPGCLEVQGRQRTGCSCRTGCCIRNSWQAFKSSETIFHGAGSLAGDAGEEGTKNRPLGCLQCSRGRDRSSVSLGYGLSKLGVRGGCRGKGHQPPLWQQLDSPGCWAQVSRAVRTPVWGSARGACRPAEPTVSPSQADLPTSERV